MVIQCNPFVANPPIFEIVGDPSPNPPPLVDAPGGGWTDRQTDGQTVMGGSTTTGLKKHYGN